MLIANIYGRLAADPVAHTTKTGKPMTTASVAVDVSGRDAEGETLWVSILAFGTQAEALLRAGKGQMVAAMGRIYRGQHERRIGELCKSWTLLADSIVTATSAKPGAADGCPQQGRRGRPRRRGSTMRCRSDRRWREVTLCCTAASCYALCCGATFSKRC